MKTVVTLIAGSAGSARLPAIAAQISQALKAPIDWLAPGRACDIATHSSDADASAIAQASIGDLPIDVLVQPAAGRRKRLLVADLESTIIENEMLEELADFLGLRTLVAEITRRAMNGEIDFAAALAERVALLRGLPVSVLDDAARRIRLVPGAQALIATLKRAEVTTALVSGGFTVFAEPIAARLGFDRVVANGLDIADGKLAGTVSAPLVTGATKRDTLIALTGARGLSLDATMAIGDGANDLPMLQAAGLGIAFRAKPAVAAAARWRVDHGDLTAMLYAQGYRAAEIIG
jgi:phosphoserine phosphatase